MTMTQDVYDVKYRLQTILRDFLVKDLRPGKADKFEISCRVFDDAYDMICFYVPKSDVVMHDDKVTCDVYLMEPVYDMYYYGVDEETEDDMLLMIQPVHRYTITDAYYDIYPEREYQKFDLMCMKEKAINEDEHSFMISFLSTFIVPNTFITFVVKKDDLYWTHNEYAKDEAHVNFNSDMITIYYKNKSTGWKGRSVVETREHVMRDFLNYKRSIYSKIPAREYLDFLQAERKISHLFAQ